MSKNNNVEEQKHLDKINSEITSIEQAISQMEQVDDEISDDDDEVLLEEFFKTTTLLLPLQDKDGMEKSYLIAKSAYSRICTTGDEDEVIVGRQLFYFIEIAWHFLNSIVLLIDERQDKALEEIIIAQEVCLKSLNDFKHIEENIEEIYDDEIAEIFPLMKFLLYFYGLIITVFKEQVENSIQINEGKYVNQILLLKKSANLIRKIRNYKFSEDDSEIIIPLITFANRLADQYEKQAEKIAKTNKTITFMPPINDQVFIVHGHDTSILQELRQILRDYNIEPVILKEMPDCGKTLIEKFENYARLSGFAFVIITPDDLVENKEKKYFQGRPNVLFELGWFCGRFGRDRIRILRKKSTEIPSDLSGILTIDFSENLEEVYRKIGKELENSGIIKKQTT